MSEAGREIVEIAFVRSNYTRSTIRNINEQCELWRSLGYQDEELYAERDVKTGAWTVNPKGK